MGTIRGKGTKPFLSNLDKGIWVPILYFPYRWVT
jgi:hypothetical protein